MTSKEVQELERTIVRNIVKRIERDLDYTKCRVEKTHGGMYGNSGRPDLTGCLCGRRFEFEVKRPGGEVTPNQCISLKRWAESGALCAVVTSPDEAIYLLRDLMDVTEWPYANAPQVFVSRHAHLSKQYTWPQGMLQVFDMPEEVR